MKTTAATMNKNTSLSVVPKDDPSTAGSSVTALPQLAPLSHATTATVGPSAPLSPSGPPSLDYQVLTRKRLIFIFCFWSLVIIDSIFMPIALYFGLWYGTSLSPNTVFSIVTAAIGGVSIIEYFLRFWRLFKAGSTCRPIGGRRAGLDWFHWVFTGTWMVLMVELIIGSTPDNPPIRLVAMPPASLLFVFGTEMCVFEIMRWRGIPSPVRISSQPKGSRLRPGLYSIIEDIVAVDGSGGTAYRERLDARYTASHVFRSMLERLTIFWAVGAEIMAAGTTAMVFAIPSGDVAYAVGWSVPFIWAGIWAGLTWGYVRKMLSKERETWSSDPKV